MRNLILINITKYVPIPIFIFNLHENCPNHTVNILLKRTFRIVHRHICVFCEVVYRLESTLAWGWDAGKGDRTAWRWRRRRWHSTGTVVAGGGAGARRDSLEFGGSAGALQEYARKWGPSPLSPPLGAALGPVGLRPVSAAPGAETAKYRCTYTPTSHTGHSRQKCPPSIDANF